LYQQNRAALSRQRIAKLLAFSRSLRPRSFRPTRLAPFIQRTNQALWSVRLADRRAQLHQCLIEVAGALAIKQPFGLPPNRFPSLAAALHPCELAFYFAVH